MVRWLISGYAALFLAWLVSNPPGSAPDEVSNYIKAVAVGRGELLGVPGAYPAEEGIKYGLHDAMLDRASQTTRWVSIPSELVPAGLACNAFRPEIPSSCTRAQPQAPFTARQMRYSARQPTYSGTYQPFAYLLPGLLTWFAPDPAGALLRARAGTAATSLILLGIAAWLLASGARSALSLAGLVVAVTPMVVFIGGTVSASGPEICAGICFFAAGLKVARLEPHDRRVWAALALSGSVLALSRPLGTVWIGLDLTLLLVIMGFRRAWSVVRVDWRTSCAVAATIGIAVGLGLGWEVAFEPHRPTTLAELLAYVPSTVGGLPQTFRDQVGMFGWTDTELPAMAYVLFSSVFLGLVILAVAFGSWRQRLLLLICGAMAIEAAVVLGAGFVLPLGFRLQGRHALAFTIVVPLLAGEILHLSARPLWRVRSGHLFCAFAAMAAVLQGVAWCVNARRYAVGVNGPLLFFSQADWSPPLGWWPWMALAMAGCLGLMGAGVIGWLKRTEPRASGLEMAA